MFGRYYLAGIIFCCIEIAEEEKGIEIMQSHRSLEIVRNANLPSLCLAL